MTETKTYQLLYAHWFEYENFRKEFPFVSGFFSNAFLQFPIRNKPVLNTMLRTRKALLTEYVQVINSTYASEQQEGKWRYMLIDESKREEFETLWQKWNDTEVEVTLSDSKIIPLR